MKTAKTLFTLLFSLLFTAIICAQDYHLIYETDIPNISFQKDTSQNVKPNYELEKGQYHILTFKEKKAISFQQDTILSKHDSVWLDYDNSHSYLIINRKETRFQWVMALYNKKVERVYINAYDKNDWRNNDPLSPPVLSDLMQYTIKRIEQERDTIIEWKAPILTYSEQTKTINDYPCKNATVHQGKWTYNVWYTEEINFNWCFDDYRFLIPGTVVLIEKEGEITFELLKIKLLDYDNLSVRKEVIDKLRRLK